MLRWIGCEVLFFPFCWDFAWADNSKNPSLFFIVLISFSGPVSTTPSLTHSPTHPHQCGRWKQRSSIFIHYCIYSLIHYLLSSLFTLHCFFIVGVSEWVSERESGCNGVFFWWKGLSRYRGVRAEQEEVIHSLHYSLTHCITHYATVTLPPQHSRH